MSNPTASRKHFSRRDFLRMMAYASSAILLTSCAPALANTSAPAATDAPADPQTVATAVPTNAPVAEATTAPTGCQVDWKPTFPSFTKYNPPVEINTPFSSGISFIEGDTLTNNPTFNRYVDQLGIQYTPSYEVAGKDYYTRLNNDLAAGTLPDVFRLNSSRIGTYVKDGALEDITDIFEATASDLVKQKKGYPDSLIWNAVRYDGRVYGIAAIEDGYAMDSLFFVRQDWLDQLKLAAPKTLDEMTNVAREMKKAGLTDFPISANQFLVTWQCSMDPVFGAFGFMTGAGASAQWWLKNSDGTLHYGSVDPALKDALAVLNGWYSEGLIDPDFINQDESAAGEKVVAGKVGMFFAPWSTGEALLPDLYLNVPEAKVEVFPLPTGPQGKKGRAGTPMVGVGVVFRKGVDAKKIEAVIKQLNWKTEMHVNWTKYQQYGEAFRGAGFYQGYEWDLDAECQMVGGGHPGEWKYQNDIVLYRMLGYPDFQTDIFQEMAKWTQGDSAKLNMAQKFILSFRDKVDDMRFYNVAYDTRADVIPSAFTGSNTDAINEVLTDLLTLEQTALLEFITGARSLDQFGEFTQEWMDRGGKVYTEEVNKWAAANKS